MASQFQIATLERCHPTSELNRSCGARPGPRTSSHGVAFSTACCDSCLRDAQASGRRAEEGVVAATVAIVRVRPHDLVCVSRPNEQNGHVPLSGLGRGTPRKIGSSCPLNVRSSASFANQRGSTTTLHAAKTTGNAGTAADSKCTSRCANGRVSKCTSRCANGRVFECEHCVLVNNLDGSLFRRCLNF